MIAPKKKDESPQRPRPADLCDVCDTAYIVSATETWGVVKCSACGAPRQILKAGSRSLIDPEWLNPTRDLWQATSKDVAPGFGFVGGGSEYEQDRAQSIIHWFAKNVKKYPKVAEWSKGSDGRFLPL